MNNARNINIDRRLIEMLKVGFGRGSPRPASAAEGYGGGGSAEDDPSWHIGEMRPRGYSAPSKHPSSRCNNGGTCQLRVPETQRSLRPNHVSHALRKVLENLASKHASVIYFLLLNKMFSTFLSLNVYFIFKTCYVCRIFIFLIMLNAY